MSPLKVAAVLLVVAVSICSANRPTHCERWKGDSEFRCGKDGYRADTVTIHNRVNGNVSFKVGKWSSVCGHPGTNTSDEQFFLGIGEAQTVDFAAANPGECKELFVFDCKINTRSANCLDAVRVVPN